MIQPMRGKLIGQVLESDRISSGGIHLPDKQKDKIPHRVRIIAVGIPEIGKKGKEIKPFAEVGSVVYIKSQAGQRFNFDGMDLIALKNSDIVGRC